MEKKIRVLECIRQGKIGGGESHLLNLVEYLDKSRFEPVVLSFTQGPMIDRLQQMGIGTDVIYTEKPFDLTKWGRVKELLKEKKVDLIHAHGTRQVKGLQRTRFARCHRLLVIDQRLGLIIDLITPPLDLL